MAETCDSVVAAACSPLTEDGGIKETTTCTTTSTTVSPSDEGHVQSVSGKIIKNDDLDKEKEQPRYSVTPIPECEQQQLVRKKF